MLAVTSTLFEPQEPEKVRGCRAAGRLKQGSIWLFDPIRHLHWGHDPFRRMGIDRSRGDILRRFHFRLGKLLRLSLARKGFGHPRKRPPALRRRFKRDEPRTLRFFGDGAPPGREGSGLGRRAWEA